MTDTPPSDLAEEVSDLAKELEDEFGEQKREDEEVKKLLRHEHGVDTQNPGPEIPIKKIFTGYPGLTVEQDFSFLTSPPFLRLNALKSSQEDHAELLESGVMGMWRLSQGAEDVWLAQVYDFVWAGRGWSVICPDPELWGDGLGRDEGESEKDYLNRVAELKESVLPFIWRPVQVENTWPKYDLRGDLDKVCSISEMKIRDIRRYYGEDLLPSRKSTEKIKVIDYADKEWLCTVLDPDKGSPEVVHAWNHGMDINPYVIAQSQRMAPMGTGIKWTGALFHTRNIMVELDSLISDIRYNIKRAVRAQIVANLDLEGRSVAPGDAATQDTLKIRPTETIVIDKDEKLSELSPAQTNVDAYKLVEILQSLTKEVAVRSVLLGVLSKGDQSGILYNTAAQFAQKQYGPAVTQLEKAAVEVGRRFLKCVETFPEADEKVPIIYATADGKTERIELKPDDVKGWDRTLQALIELAIPVNETSDITNARLLTDPANPLLSYETVAAKYLHIENPNDEWTKIVRTQVKRTLIPMITQVISESGLHLISEPSQSSGEDLSSMFTGLPVPVQQAIAAHAAQTGQQVPQQTPPSGGAPPPTGGVQGGGQLARSAANANKLGRFENTTAVGQMNPLGR